MATADGRNFVGLVNDFAAGAGDAEARHASINQYLCKVFGDVSPADITREEASALVEALEPAFLRVTGSTVNSGAPNVPCTAQLQELLNRLAPADLSATEAILVLTILVPIHSRVITARSADGSGRPVQRLLLGPVE